MERLTQTDAAQIMTPRHKLHELAKTASLKEAVAVATSRNSSFLAITEPKTDELLGVAYADELLTVLYKGGEDKILEDILRKPLFVPESRQLLEIFADLADNGERVVFVVDEAGQVNGALTRHRLMAFAMAEMAHKRRRGELIENGDGTIQVGAAFSIAEIEKQYGKFADEEEKRRCDTVGGLVALLAGRIPAVGEVVQNSKGIRFRVLETFANRITRVQITLPPGSSSD